VAPPGDDVRKAMAETVAELNYNLARAHDNAGRPDLSIPLYEKLASGDPGDHRYAERLVGALMETGDRTRARAVLDAFDARCAVDAPAAEAELKRRREEKPDETLDPRKEARDQRESFDRRVLAERATGFGLLRAVLRLRLDLADERFDEARQRLDGLEALYQHGGALSAMLLARPYELMGDDKRALEWIERALEHDPEDWEALALAARLHLRGGRYGKARDAAAESLALIYFQPIVHYVLGSAQSALGDLEGAERSLRVAIAQMPGLVPAHEALVRLYEGRLEQPAHAALHRARVVELLDQANKRRETRPEAAPDQPTHTVVPSDALAPLPARDGDRPADAGQEIVIVAGLPRSGTSMVMQMLAAGGISHLTDGRRPADEDNPRGYFEFEAATRLGRDASWVPQARAKAVKLALPLVRLLPRGESYRVLIIEREPREVIASQRKMLKRLGRSDEGAALDDEQLAAEFLRQRERLRVWLEHRPEVAVLPLRYDGVLSDPEGAANRIAAFLGRAFDVAAAAASVDPALHRVRMSKEKGTDLKTQDASEPSGGLGADPKI
jgi:tetratricopeptide (TPR) repeat protein